MTVLIYSVSPFRSGVSIALGVGFHQRANYVASWNQVRGRFSQFSDTAEWQVTIPAADDAEGSYENASTDDYRRRGELATFEIRNADYLRGLFAADTGLIPEACRISVYPHGVSVAEVVWPIPEHLGLAEARALTEVSHRRLLVALDPSLTALTEELIREARRSGITFTASEPLEAAPLWCSAAIVIDQDTHIDADVANAWFGAQGLSMSAVERFCTAAPETDSIALWMRYGYRVTEEDSQTLFDAVAIRAMRYSQYVFAAGDIADNDLLEILGQSYGMIRRGDIERIRRQLEERSNRMRVVELEHAAVLKSIAPDERGRIEETLGSWEFERLVVGPGTMKTTAAQDRLAELGNRNARSASLITEVILLFIALTSLFGTSVALMQYGRQMVTDPNLSGYAQESGSVLDYVAGFSTDGLLTVTLVVCAALAVAYTVVKWRNR